MSGPVRRGDLDPSVLADAAAALGRQEDDVAELRDQGDLLAALLARLVLEHRRGGPGANASAGRLLVAIRDGWGRAPFGAGELVQWAEALPIAGRRAILATARAVLDLPARADVTAQRMGLALRRCVDTATPEGDRLDGSARRGGAVLWRILEQGDPGG